MVTRRISFVHCDMCAHLGREDIEATYSFTVRINGEPSRLIDVCDDHATELFRLQTVLRTRGTRTRHIEETISG